MMGLYNEWFARYGLWDFVEDLVTPEEIKREQVLVQITGGTNAKLTAHNLREVLALL